PGCRLCELPLGLGAPPGVWTRRFRGRAVSVVAGPARVRRRARHRGFSGAHGRRRPGAGAFVAVRRGKAGKPVSHHAPATLSRSGGAGPAWLSLRQGGSLGAPAGRRLRGSSALLPGAGPAAGRRRILPGSAPLLRSGGGRWTPRVPARARPRKPPPKADGTLQPLAARRADGA